MSDRCPRHRCSTWSPLGLILQVSFCNVTKHPTTTIPPPCAHAPALPSPLYLCFILLLGSSSIMTSLGFPFLISAHFSLCFLPVSSLSSHHTVPVSAAGCGVKDMSCFPLGHADYAPPCCGPSRHRASLFVSVVLLIFATHSLAKHPWI